MRISVFFKEVDIIFPEVLLADDGRSLIFKQSLAVKRLANS
jgi:hypothetical protein